MWVNRFEHGPAGFMAKCERSCAHFGCGCSARDSEAVSTEGGPVGFFDKLMDGIASISGTSTSLDECPYCHGALAGFSCPSCDVEFVYEDDKMVERGLSRRGPRPEVRCVSCDMPMSRRSECVGAWEDGDNGDAYVKCSNCGYKNPA